MVSDDTPLLVELSANENISLILKCHYGYSVKKAKKATSKLLKECGYEDIEDKKPFEMIKKEKLAIQYIRAYVSKFDDIAVIKPLSIVDRVEDIEEIFRLKGILEDKDVCILDTVKHDFYKDKTCHIIG